MKFENVKVGNYYRIIFNNGLGDTVDAIFTCDEIENGIIVCKVLITNASGFFGFFDWAPGKIRRLTRLSVEKYVTELNNENEENF
jgi:hypothetical protein